MLSHRKRGFQSVQQRGDAFLLHAVPDVHCYDAHGDDVPSGDGILQEGTPQLLVCHHKIINIITLICNYHCHCYCHINIPINIIVTMTHQFKLTSLTPGTL